MLRCVKIFCIFLLLFGACDYCLAMMCFCSLVCLLGWLIDCLCLSCACLWVLREVHMLFCGCVAKKWLKRPIFGRKNAKNGGFLRVLRGF